MINKKRLKHLPFNMLWCISSWIIPYMILTAFFPEINTGGAALISMVFYFMDIKQQTDHDFLEERIKELEENQKK